MSKLARYGLMLVCLAGMYNCLISFLAAGTLATKNTMRWPEYVYEPLRELEVQGVLTVEESAYGSWDMGNMLVEDMQREMLNLASNASKSYVISFLLFSLVFICAVTPTLVGARASIMRAAAPTPSSAPQP